MPPSVTSFSVRGARCDQAVWIARSTFGKKKKFVPALEHAAVRQRLRFEGVIGVIVSAGFALVDAGAIAGAVATGTLVTTGATVEAVIGTTGASTIG